MEIQTTAVSQKNKNYLTGLNGLRIIAALLILFGHIAQDCYGSWSKQMGGESFLPGGGLVLFFVLSGFLASYTLQINPDFSVKNYYKKKVLRILPLYYLYIVFSLIAFSLIGKSSVLLCKEFIYYVIPLGNIPFSSGEGIAPFLHLWYVGAIIQFYLIYPWIAKITKEKLMFWSFIICLFWIVIKVALYILAKGSFAHRIIGCTQFDSLFLGVFIGTLVINKNKIITHIQNSAIVFIITWMLFLSSGFYSHLIPSVIRNDFFAVITGLLILGQIASKPVFSLENKILNTLGEISYGIYVWQITIIILLSELYTFWGGYLQNIIIYSIVTIITIVISYFSYYYFEKPFYKKFK